MAERLLKRLRRVLATGSHYLVLTSSDLARTKRARRPAA